MGSKINTVKAVIPFVKMVASGNDFAVVDDGCVSGTSKKLALLARGICDRKFGAGADGVLLLGKMPSGSVRMRIFNADGSEAEMCGNGARCAALFSGRKQVDLYTKAGVIACRVDGDRVKIRLTDPGYLRSGVNVTLDGRALRTYFINTGVPHAVIFVQGLDDIDVESLGRRVRYHRVFSPAGANADFAEITDSANVKVRTYERGVEGETLACGTGSTAAALAASCHLGLAAGRITFNILTRGGGTLKVYFNKGKDCSFSDVWLEGGAKIVYKGVYYV
ncbi:MAG: diaminopimelate epimerase [Candidatus Omnitrophota bacterium]